MALEARRIRRRSTSASSTGCTVTRDEPPSAPPFNVNRTKPNKSRPGYGPHYWWLDALPTLAVACHESAQRRRLHSLEIVAYCNHCSEQVLQGRAIPEGGRCVVEPEGDLLDFYQALDQLMRASRVISGVITASIANLEAEVTLPELRTLMLVVTRPGISGMEVAEELEIHPSNATQLIDRLVQGGYLQRSDSAADRRHLHLRPTMAGSDLIEQVMEHRRRRFERILGRMTAADRHLLSAALEPFIVGADEPHQAGFRI